MYARSEIIGRVFFFRIFIYLIIKNMKRKVKIIKLKYVVPVLSKCKLYGISYALSFNFFDSGRTTAVLNSRRHLTVIFTGSSALNVMK